MSDAILAREPLPSILESGLPALLAAHWAEVAHDQGVIALDVDWESYKEDEAAGRFIAFSLRRDGELIGYNAFFVVRPRHYKSVNFAINDVVYLKRDERGVDGISMILQAEKALRDLGVTKAFYHVKTDAELGAISGDSLEQIEQEMELEELTGMDADAWKTATADDRTLGGVLRALGYNHIENQFGKLLTGAG